MQRHKKQIAVIVLFTIIAGMLGAMPEIASAISDSKDVNPAYGAKLKFNGRDGVSLGRWTIYIDNQSTGDALAITDELNDGQGGNYWTGDIWNLVHRSLQRNWENVLTPTPDPTGYYEGATFSRDLSPDIENWTVQYNGITSSRFHLRELAEKLGASVSYNERNKSVYITTSRFPSGAMEHTSNIKDGEPFTIQIRGTAYNSDVTQYELYAGSTRVKVDKPNSRTFNSSASVTLAAGKRILMLKITDSIGRTTTYTKYVEVEGIPVEPPDEPGDPGGPSSGPIADFTMPSQAAEWDPVRIKNTSTPPPGGRIVEVEWKVSTSNYEGEFNDSGGTLYFPKAGRTPDITLTVTDDKGRSDSITKTITIVEWVPPSDDDDDEDDDPPWWGGDDGKTEPEVQLEINREIFFPGDTAEFTVEIKPNDFSISFEAWKIFSYDTQENVKQGAGIIPSTMIIDLDEGMYRARQEAYYYKNGELKFAYNNENFIVVKYEPLTADFMANPWEQFVGENIELINTSKGYVEENWYIRKQGSGSYSKLNLSGWNEFSKDEAGIYDIKLVVGDGRGNSKEVVKQVEFKEIEPLVVDFDAIPSKTIIGSYIELMNKSTGYTKANWHIKKTDDSNWEPLHLFDDQRFTRVEVGKYDVRLTVSNSKDELSLIKQVEFTEPSNMRAVIYATPPNAVAGQSVRINNNSFGDYVSYQWYLDGEPVEWPKSGTTLVEHIPRTRSIKLEIRDSNGYTDEATTTVTWSALPELKAKITASTTSATAGDTVNIYNNSSGTYDDWTWTVSGQIKTWGRSGGMIIAEEGSTVVSLTIRNTVTGQVDTDTVTISAKKPNVPPRAIIKAPNYIIRGETINIEDLSFDKDGSIVHRQWQITGTDKYEGNLKTDGSGGNIVVDDFTTITVKLMVRDNEGAIATDEVEIIVGGNEPPEIRLSEDGTKKQNRKYSIDLSGSTTGQYYQIDWSKMEITVVPLSDGVDETTIKSVRKPKGIDLLFKEPGVYRIKAAIEDSGGRSDSQELDVLIAPDESPVNNILLDKTNVYRNEYIQLVKEITSPDDDIIQEQSIKMYYDSDNDGNFTDEEAINIFGNKMLVFNKVGRYKITSFVKEEFGQETIEQFVTDADRRTATFETIINVDNRPPTAEIRADVPSKKEKVDVLILTDSKLDNGSEYYYIKSGANLPNRDYIRNNLTAISNMLANKNIDVRVFKKDFKVDVYEKDISENRKFHLYTTNENSMPATVDYSDPQGYSGTLAKQPGVTWTTKYTNVTTDFTESISRNNSTQDNNIFDTSYYIDKNKYVVVNPSTGYSKNVTFTGYIPRSNISWSRQYNYYHQDVTETVVQDNPTQDDSIFDNQLWYSQGGYSGLLNRTEVQWEPIIEQKYFNDSTTNSVRVYDLKDPNSVPYSTFPRTVMIEDGKAWLIVPNQRLYLTSILNWEGPFTYTGTKYTARLSNSKSNLEERERPSLPSREWIQTFIGISARGISGSTEWTGPVVGPGSYKAWNSDKYYSYKRPYKFDYTRDYYNAIATYAGQVLYQTVTGYTGTATYSGTVTKSEFSHYRGTATYSGSLSAVTTDGYYGESNYQGTVYRYVPDNAEPIWRTEAKKYIIYVSDENGMNDLGKLKNYQEKSGAKVIYIGLSDYSDATTNIRYSDLAQNILEAIEFIAVEEELETRDAVLINEEYFDLEVEDEDPENDTIIERVFKYEHDPNVYFNPEGQSSLPSVWSTYRASMLDKPGKYVISYRVKDQASENASFEDYNKYSNIAQIVLFGHRRPVVTDFNVNFEYNPATGKYENPDFLVAAYDPDYYDVSTFRGRADKGIKEYAYEWKKKDEAEFKYGVPNSLDAGTYVFKVMARDIDDAWSLPFKKEVVLSDAEFILKGIFEPEDSKFNPAVGIPASEELRVRYIETIHAYPVDSVEFSLYQDGSSQTPIKKLTNPADVMAIDKSLIQWDPIRFYQIPETLPDGNYVATLTARANNVSASLRWDVKVVTPVDLQINVPAELYIDETNSITATTSKYVNKVTMQLDSKNYNLSLVRTVGDKKEWQYDLFLPEDFPLGEYTVFIAATTPNGNSETKTAEVLVEDPLSVIGDTDKDAYMAGQAMLLNAFTEGRAYKVEAKVWFKNKHTNSNVTELIPERFLGDPPEKQMEWRTRRYKDDPGGRDLVVIIPPDMPDGIYQVEFTAYKESADGTIKTAHDTITVRVEGVVYDRSYSEIIGGPR